MTGSSEERYEERTDTGVGGDTGPEFGAFFGDWTGDGRAFHLAFGVDDHTGVVLEVEPGAVLPSPGLRLADDDCGHNCNV